MLFFIKIIVGGFLIALVSELSKRSETLATMIVSMPIISIITFLFIYFEQRDVPKIARMSHEMIYLMIPSFTFFVLMPILINKFDNFWLALILSIVTTGIFYYFMVKFLGGAE
jgi:uncharacterized membrane protein (GlpM family)